MPTEQTFADRLGRALQLQAAIANMGETYAPADSSLTATNFMTFLEQLGSLNTQTADLVDQYTTKVGERTTLVKSLNKLATRVLAYVKSNKAWAKHLPALKAVVHKLRGKRPKAPKAPAAGETPAQKKKRNQGERSFAEMEGHWNRLIKAVEKITGFDPPANEIKLAQIQAVGTQLHDLNLLMHDLGIDVGNIQKQRLAAFNGEDGAKEKMKAIKEAVKSQFGTDSPEYATVKAIKL